MPKFGSQVFGSGESVTSSLAAEPTLLYGTHRLNVEEQMMRGWGQDRGQGGNQLQGQEQRNRVSQV